MQKVLIGFFFVIGGLSGHLVLRGTHSTKALIVVGIVYIGWGFMQANSDSPLSGPSGPYGGKAPPPQPHMNESEIQQWIARELGRLQKPDNLIVTVCERTGMNWEDAKELIKRVQDGHVEIIGRGKQRFAAAFGMPIIIAGSILLIGSTYSLIQTMSATDGDIVPTSVYGGLILGVLMVGGGLYGLLQGKHETLDTQAESQLPNQG